MRKISRRQKKNLENINKAIYSDLQEAIITLRKTSNTKFVETVELHANLNIDPKYANQQLRTTVTLPNGNGKADKTGIVHVNFGNVNFTDEQLTENITKLYQSIEQNRPSGVKGKYFKSLFLCTSMGPSIKLDLNIFA